MGAETTVYVKVTKLHTEIVETSALTLQDAAEKVAQEPGVVTVEGAAYERSELEDHDVDTDY